MADANEALERYFLEMRWRCLSLAADLDRIERFAGGPAVLTSDPRLHKLREALGILARPSGANRAEQVQLIFSDKTPPPR